MGIAMAVRRRADCIGNRVGSVVVLDRRIISTGYNGTPENMDNCSDGGCHRCANRDKYPPGNGLRSSAYAFTRSRSHDVICPFSDTADATESACVPLPNIV